jgi:pimeloyl-ACP methyl ester carboxylesterase
MTESPFRDTGIHIKQSYRNGGTEMNTQTFSARNKQAIATNENRYQLLKGLPVSEQQLYLAGISTAVLAGGEGSPVILLHGPGESSLWWMRVIPKLVETHRVIVPDLPGHGESVVSEKSLGKDLVSAWLSELIEQTCPSPPTLAGNILGGSIGARFAIRHSEQLEQLVLVNSLGLAKFRPAPSFAFGLFRFILWPTQKNFNRFFPHCMYDVDELHSHMGQKWEPFMAYNLECAQDKDRKTAMQSLMKEVGITKIPDEKLKNIEVPTALIWGRHDKANKLRIAKAANKKYGWPLHIIEESRDDPKLEQPVAFTNTLYKILNRSRL